MMYTFMTLDNNTQQALRDQAVFRLMAELKKGEDSAAGDNWISEEALLDEFGVM